ncbi:DNA-binding protein [Herbaspirillum sp. ST 5-3]|uniref:DNA-binding protein n=1 Tax=Oxalobacteraceae TaxID=75682 RepID=UPI0010A330FE|nr:DNA-binding protein [Herbaspirillum sp. ST 5-3]
MSNCTESTITPAAQLVEGGKNPTVDSVREALGGTGSKSTIAPLLKRWKTEHQSELAQAEAGLPPSLLAAVQGLHQHMQAEFAQQLEQAKQLHAETLRAAAERELQTRTERDAVIVAQKASTEELARSREALAQLQASHQVQSVTLATVQAENAGLQQRLADRAADVATLDHQLNQARAQFEHFQDATAAQRAAERQGYEQRIARLEQELTRANRHIATQQATLSQQEAGIAHLRSDLGDAQQAARDAQEELATVRTARDRMAERLDATVAARDDLVVQLAAAQRELTDVRIALAAQEREASLLAERVRRVEERADQLAEERLSWRQERATLEQRLRATEQGPHAAPPG